MSGSLWAVPSLQTWSQKSNLNPTGVCPFLDVLDLAVEPWEVQGSPAPPRNVLWTALPNVSLYPPEPGKCLQPRSLPWPPVQQLKPGQEGRAPPPAWGQLGSGLWLHDQDPWDQGIPGQPLLLSRPSALC